MRLHVERLEARDTPSAAGLYAVGAGPGGTPRVKVFSGVNNALLGDFQAFENNFTGGVNVAVGDVSNDGIPDVIVAAGQGGGPRVRVFDGRAFTGNGSPIPRAPLNNTAISNAAVIADFFAFETAQRGGAYVTSGNITGNTNAEVIVGAGPGGGPRVRIFDGNAINVRRAAFNTLQSGDVSADFFAFESSFRNGVLVSVNPPIQGTTAVYLGVTPGVGGSPRVRVLNGNAITLRTTSYNTFQNGDVVADFFSGNPNDRRGAFVSTADYNRDGTPDIAIGTGIGTNGSYTIYSGALIAQRRQNFTGAQSGDVLFASPVGGTGYTNGVTVGSTVVAGSLLDGLLMVGFGSSTVASRAQLIRFNLVGGGLVPQLLNDIVFDSNFRGGVFAGN